MTKPPKLYERLLSGTAGTTAFFDFERLVFAFGFKLERQRGSHRIYSHSRCPRPLVLQPRGNDAKPYQIREFMVMIEEYDLTLQT